MGVERAGRFGGQNRQADKPCHELGEARGHQQTGQETGRANHRFHMVTQFIFAFKILSSEP